MASPGLVTSSMALRSFAQSRAGENPPVSVVICAYTFARLDLTLASVSAVLAQRVPHETIVVVDHNDALLRRLEEAFYGRAAVIPNLHERGLSGARNSGIDRSRGSIVAFVDDDAVAPDGWLERLVEPFGDDRVIAAGGHARPVWDGDAPAWFPDEFLWVVGCSYTGMVREGAVRNVLGCNMAFRSEIFPGAGPFDPAVGRLGSKPVGCEETELCIRARRWRPGSAVVLIEGAEVVHHVSPGRRAFRYYLSRCYHEGRSKAVLRRLAGGPALESERAYLSHVLPGAVLRSAWEAVARRRPAALLRAGAIVAGVAAVGIGFAVGSAKRGGSATRTPAPASGAAGPASTVDRQVGLSPVGSGRPGR